MHAETAANGLAPGEAVELILVDSSEPPLDPANIPAWDASWMRVSVGTRNVRQKRNRGAAEARAPYVAFVDSDCVVASGYFRAVLSAIDCKEGLAFAGRVEFAGRDTWLWRVVAASQLVTPETQTAGDGDVAWCATANLIVERRLFASLGGFDQSLPFRLGGDDVDFGLRLQGKGNALRVLPEALVLHAKEPWSRLTGIVPRAWRWGRVEYHVAWRHRDKVRSAPPFFLATILTVATMCAVGSVLAARPVLLWMLPLWILTSTLLATVVTGQGSSASIPCRYLAGWLDRLYHLGAAWEHVRAGSPRFLWEALVLDDHMEHLFPAEPLLSWSNLLSLLLVGLVGAAVVAR